MSSQTAKVNYHGYIFQLRDVVRACTNTDPMKRPTAREVIYMLNQAPNEK